jgi:hypothetical protein
MSAGLKPIDDRRVESLRISRYDQTSGLLLTVLLTLGTITLLMFLIWLSSRTVWVSPAVPVTVLEDVGGGGSGNMAPAEREIEEPPTSEVQEMVEQPITQTLDEISHIVGTGAVDFDAFTTAVVEGSTGTGHGKGSGIGDGTGKGPGGPGTSDGIPAWERWEVRMTAPSDIEYAKMLDFFKVELGVAGGGRDTVDYISNLSAPRPTVRAGDPKKENRLRFLHRSGELRQADRRLAANAGVKTDGRIVFQFYDQATYQKLLALENARMGSHRIREVARTIFGVRGPPGRYEFFVIDQHYIGGA